MKEIQTKNNYQETRGKQPSEKILRDSKREKEYKNEKTRKSEWVRQKEKRSKRRETLRENRQRKSDTETEQISYMPSTSQPHVEQVQ